jgi:hypothetical protein
MVYLVAGNISGKIIILCYIRCIKHLTLLPSLKLLFLYTSVSEMVIRAPWSSAKEDSIRVEKYCLNITAAIIITIDIINFP